MTTPIILTGNQIAAARGLADIGQEWLADQVGVDRKTITKAEKSGTFLPAIRLDVMSRIVNALESAGVEFALEGNRISIRNRAPANPVIAE